MKNTPLMLALLITVGAVSGALADDKKQDKQTKEKPANSQARHSKRKIPLSRARISNATLNAAE
jgi:hypothetical protein